MNKVNIEGGHMYSVDGNVVNNETIIADILQNGERFYHILYNNKNYDVEVIKIDKISKSYTLRVNGNIYNAQVKDTFAQLMEAMGFDSTTQHKLKELKAPMPGLVLDIKMQPGDVVKKGDAVIVLEAMKMENVLKASGDGVVKSVEVQKGKSVEKNQVLIIFE
jgi:biotin carboxyl carrier protein